ncbi:cytosine deaminase [Halarchaeum rubridurum]|uniref:Cytosine deaminase n=1 Tax=Halarchaeum rubridurum TaxID=489911 RepID=A0A830G5H5_9EURY|nr:cytosine deaminase [Halarchaeum rubridurum]MBP1955981.1 cytosine deaminase [Halarchaeum rubridurum]GGM76210.1 cytosine deaminase [Halarchaeum rubridurum]
MSDDYLVRDATTLDGRRVDVAVRDGQIDAVREAGAVDPGAFDDADTFDADGRLVTPPLIEPHIHLDATLTAGEPTWNESGTLAEGIDVWAERKGDLTKADVKARARETIDWLVSHGITRVRTHADTTEATLTGVEALCELREELDAVDLQVVAFPQDGVFTDPAHEDLLREAVDLGVDVIGGIPHNEHTREDGVRDVKTAADLAERHDLPLDLHIDETDDPGSRFTEVLASEALKRGIGDRTTASHATALHSYPNAHAAKVVSLLAESGVSVVTNPPDNSVLQGSYDDYPRRRGHTRIDELREAGVTVGIGHDSVVDPWYHYGVGDQLDAAFVLLHYAHMAGHDDVGPLWEMLTTANAEVFGVGEEYGLDAGCDGSLVVYDARSPFDALRTRAARLRVVSGGREVARTDPATHTVSRGGATRNVTYDRP